MRRSRIAISVLLPLAPIFAGLATWPSPERQRAVVALALLAVLIPWAQNALAFRRGGEELSVLTPLLVFAAHWYLRPGRARSRVGASARAPILR